jgi:hypothetical protein
MMTRKLHNPQLTKGRPSWRSFVVCAGRLPRQYRAFVVSSSALASNAAIESDTNGSTLGGSIR